MAAIVNTRTVAAQPDGSNLVQTVHIAESSLPRESVHPNHLLDSVWGSLLILPLWEIIYLQTGMILPCSYTIEL